jgi:hypothetical protein
MVRICLSGAAHRRASPLLVVAVALASLTIAASFSLPPSLPAASLSLASGSLRVPRRAAVLAGRAPQRSFLCMKDKDSKEGGDSPAGQADGAGGELQRVGCRGPC